MFRRAVSHELGESVFTPERTLPLLQAAWAIAVGPRLAERTEPIGLQGGTLLVRVPDARWQRILQRLRREILSRLREVAGARAPRALGFVEARPRQLPVAVPRPEAARGDQARPTLSPELAAQAARIPDEELRARFEETAARYLATAAARRAAPAAPSAPLEPSPARDKRGVKSDCRAPSAPLEPPPAQPPNGRKHRQKHRRLPGRG